MIAISVQELHVGIGDDDLVVLRAVGRIGIVGLDDVVVEVVPGSRGNLSSSVGLDGHGQGMVRIDSEAADVFAAEGNSPVLEEVAEGKDPGRAAAGGGIVEVKQVATDVEWRGIVVRMNPRLAQELAPSARNQH